MKIYLIRHAQAVPEGPRLTDEARWLSAEGRRAARAVGKRLLAENVAFDVILASPLVRAVQTAELLAGVMDYLAPVEATGALAPGVPPRAAAEAFTGRGAAVAAIGHEPGLSALGAFLTRQPGFPPFRTCQVAMLEEGRAGWTLNPETMTIDRLLLG